MAITGDDAALRAGGNDVPRRPRSSVTFGDRVFRSLSVACASVSLLIVVAILVFLLAKSHSVFLNGKIWSFFTSSVWNPGMKRFGVGGLILGTILIAGIALAIGLPIALSMALFINEYAPARVRRILTTVVDLLAALPSLLYGVWGFLVLQKQLIPIATWLNAHLSAIPLFRLDPEAKLVKSSFVAGVVVGIMIMPIITSVARDVMAQVPREQCEGALALGGTKWGMIRDVILPYGRTGIVGATLLGFGRALGETIAVAVIVSLTFKVNWHVLSTGGGSIAALIASRFGEATPSEIRGLVAAGLALFFLTFVVNFIARRVVNRGAKR